MTEAGPRRSRIDEYRAVLLDLPDPEPFALAHSGLPGPRANLELIAVLAELSDEVTLRRWAALTPAEAPGDAPPVVLAAAGIVGLGRFLHDRADLVERLHALARDPRWRVREAVAMAFQRAGTANPAALVGLLRPWAADPDALVQRAVVAALCEPALLRDADVAARVLGVLDGITSSLVARADRRSEAVRVLRQTLGYGWSVAIVASPGIGKPAFERWLDVADPDIRWMVRENLGKARLRRLDAQWVEASRARLLVPIAGKGESPA
ncbi:MAG TPA: HEAT repeat domain-containing protein [Candidatus Limnocylindrales bacterium]|nr:HEAT repeat domain-containing protein [Candidatus Limnocylindrales bacterium]